jgi:hypothetical protein
MRIISWTISVALAASLAACATPSRRLSSRVVEDPIALPQRMAEVDATAMVTGYRRGGETATSYPSGFSLGLTDRLEWEGLFSLKYALLDDSPGRSDQATPRPMSLAVRAGVIGFGHIGADGWILLPLISLQTQKHINGLWLLGATAALSGRWSSAMPVSNDQLSRSSLWPEDSTWSEWWLGLAATRQVTSRVALGVAGGAGQVQGCLLPSCIWQAREVSGNLRFLLRPTSWLTLALYPGAGFRFRPGTLATPIGPADDASPPPESVWWLSGEVSAAFFW